GYYHTAWTTNGPRGPAPKLAQLDETARLTTGDDLAAAITRGELAAKDALAELRALADSHDPYAQLGAIAIARALDHLVDDTTRPAWSAWLAARFSDRFAPAHRAVVENELANEVVTLISADRFPSAVTRAAAEALGKMIADGGRDLPEELVTLAAAPGGDKLFMRIADRARTLPEESRTDWLESLGHFGAAQAPLAVALLTDPSFPADEAWSAVDGYFVRPATRSEAWRALKPALPAALKRMPAGKAAEMIDATGALCDTTSRDEVAAAFTPHLSSIQDGKAHLDRALASIDHCVTTRGTLGDIAAALAASK
ncbi:MAG TPA: hypothetical protein VLB44_15030, partial [Kofleriaceae bacterium]|nr:hypothetical protein [Kofleriaceae bacterium]